MKTIVFGGSGFLGSHVADALSAASHDVTIFDLKSSPFLGSSQKMITGDILDETSVADALQGADYVYHYAGIADLDDATTQSLETIKQNILGTAVLLKACVAAKIKRFIYGSSVYVYSTLGGFYRCSKQSAEIYIEEYQKKYGLDYTILRYGTLYGPRANEKNSVYRYLTQALKDKKIVCTGTGDEVREYIYVKDAAILSAEILSDDYINKHIIITGHNQMKFSEMLAMIREMLNNKVDVDLRSPVDNAHYNITPYSFHPKIGQKLVSHLYTDMGQGMLECLTEIHTQLRLEADK